MIRVRQKLGMSAMSKAEIRELADYGCSLERPKNYRSLAEHSVRLDEEKKQ